MANNSMDVRAKQRLSFLACLFNSNGLGGGFAPRHLKRSAFLCDMKDVKTRQSKFAVTIFFILLLTACGTKNPEIAITEFYSSGGAEDQLMDPLILAGDKVVPLVIEEIKDKNMPRRLYAISFLGNGSYEQALPVLQEILQDNTENENFRSAALRAIYDIDEKLGASNAQKYESQSDYLGRQAKSMLQANSSLRERRSYWDAWIGRHD